MVIRSCGARADSLRSVRRVIFLAVALVLVAVPGVQAACTGDCDGDGRVTVSELIRGVNIALGIQDLANCLVFDGNEDGRVSIGELIGGVNASLSGCPIEPIFPADYRDTYTEVRGCRLSIEHGGVSIRVFANQTAAGPYFDLADPLPLGSVVVKEEYDGQDCEADGELVRWRAMRKEEPGFDPDDNDWHWQWVEPDRSVTFDDKTTCISCHRAPACVERDYMCTQGEALASGRMRLIQEGLAGALLSITGSGPDDVYAVGADPDDGKGPLFLHYDGTAWQRLESGASGDLWWISLVQIDGSYFLCGDGGLVLSYAPATGVFTPYQTPGNERLYGIWGASADAVWAVGGDVGDLNHGGVVWRYDGVNWTAVDLSQLSAQGIPVLYKIWGRAADDIYAVGEQSFTLHYDGNAWTEVPNLLQPTENALFTVNGNADITVASGGFFLDSVLLEGPAQGEFADRTPSGVPQLNGIYVTEEGAGASVGREGAVALRREGVWSMVDSQLDTILDFHAVWIDPEGGIWAVGGDLTSDFDDGMLAYSGRREIASGIDSLLRRGLTPRQQAIVAEWVDASQ